MHRARLCTAMGRRCATVRGAIARVGLPSAARAMAVLWLAGLVGLAAAAATVTPLSAAELRQRFVAEVDRRLDVPPDLQSLYARRLDAALAQAGVAPLSLPQIVVLVDRSVNVQALLLYLLDAPGAPDFIGATPVSTGSAGRVDHFLTPLGVFAHTLDNPDFRAEGTLNENGIRGYGARGMRVFDCGWVVSDRTWGAGGRSPMRLQMHATDPDKLEQRLGRADSKGCVRIPATLNRFIDRYALLDADYEAAFAGGERAWLPLAERMPVAWPGRYLVVIDSATSPRPNWAVPAPARPLRVSGEKTGAEPAC